MWNTVCNFISKVFVVLAVICLALVCLSIFGIILPEPLIYLQGFAIFGVLVFGGLSIVLKDAF